MKYYAGIGSRETPSDILNVMTEAAQYLEGLGYTLRSGGAEGADTAFERGTNQSEVYRPEDANGDIEAYNLLQHVCDNLQDAPKNAMAIKPYIKNLLARNMYQILGKELDSPVEFVMCWTPDAQLKGGTRYAIKLAQLRSIMVYNLADQDIYTRVLAKIRR